MGVGALGVTRDVQVGCYVFFGVDHRIARIASQEWEWERVFCYSLKKLKLSGGLAEFDRLRQANLEKIVG